MATTGTPAKLTVISVPDTQFGQPMWNPKRDRARNPILNPRERTQKTPTTMDTTSESSTQRMNWTGTWGCVSTAGRPGHQWRDCQEPLKDSLKAAKERLNKIARDKANQLNQNGDALDGREPASPKPIRPRPTRPRPGTKEFPTHSLRVLE